MDIEKIFNIFCRLTGLERAQAVNLRFLCEGAAEYLRSRLTAVPEPDSGCKLNYAAAAAACYRYTLLCMTDGMGSNIKIGQLSVSTEGLKQVEAAEKLCRDAFTALGSLISDNEFAFKGV